MADGKLPISHLLNAIRNLKSDHVSLISVFCNRSANSSVASPAASRQLQLPLALLGKFMRASFRAGDRYEGEEGVTVVELVSN